MRVIVRDWLSANHVLFLEATRGNVLVDTGYGSRVADTFAALEHADALADAGLDRIVNTHAHSDHVGGNAALRRRYRCRISIPAGEAALVDAWDERALLLGYADQRCERYAYDDTIGPGDTLQLGGLDWVALAAPGHDMGALVLHCPQERLLISGDALWRHGFGFVEPEAGSTRCLDAARATLERIATLDVRVVIPGHGPPFTEVAAAIDRCLARVEQLRGDPARMAWSGLKAFFVFSLLDRGHLPLAGLERHLQAIGVFRDWNRDFVRKPWPAFARDLIADLERAGAVRREGAHLLPA